MDRLNACMAVFDEEAETGRDLLLAVSICLDVDDSERLDALQQLLTMDPTTVAAAAWLMWVTGWERMEGVYKAEAAGIIPGPGAVQDSLAAGLEVVVNNDYLDDLYEFGRALTMPSPGRTTHTRS